MQRESVNNAANRTSDMRMREAMPSNTLDVSQRMVSVFQPQKIVSDVDASKRVFRKFSNFRKEFDEGSSKADYKAYLGRVLSEKRHYDSNIGNSLAHQKKFLAYKNKELAQRASALHGNSQQDAIHKSVVDHAILKIQLEKSANVRVQPDQYNYRSPKKYVSRESAKVL